MPGQMQKEGTRVRILLAIVIFGLVVSGLTAFPLPWEVDILVEIAGPGTSLGARFPNLAAWLDRVSLGLMDVSGRYPFMSYGTDWLAFAHIVIAIAFIGPLRDPVRNRWVIQFGMISCALVPVLAFVAGSVRGIPLFWQLIDCSFGVFGFLPLAVADRMVAKMEQEQASGRAA